MYRKFTAFLLFISITSNLQAQDTTDWNYNPLWQARPSIGVNVPLTKLFNRSATDNLIDYSDGPTYYYQFLTVSWFFHKHWGLEGVYQRSFSGRIIGWGKAGRFSRAVQHEYQDEYFVTTSTSAWYENKIMIFRSVDRFLIGMLYRKNFGRFFLLPKVGVGITAFGTDRGSAVLKQRNSNTTLHVNYSTRHRQHYQLTSSVSFIGGYKLSKTIYWNFEIMASGFKTNFAFRKETVDLTTDQSVNVAYIPYKKDIITLTAGTGIIVVLK